MTTTTAIGYRRCLPISDPASLVTEQVDVPELGPHDLLVEVAAVSVNPIDIKQRSGVAPDGFRVLGFDAAGTVQAVGAEATFFAPGDEVFYAGTLNRPGSNQRLQAVDERIVGRKPRTVSMGDAASLPLTSITAWETLFDRFGLTDESRGTLLVVGATGGVGSVMLQLARALLPRVETIATASDDERSQWVRRLGATYVVNHRGDLAQQVLAIAPGGVDWLFTAHTPGQVATYAEIVRPFGEITAIDVPDDIAPLKAKSITWHWESMFTRSLFTTPDLALQHELLDVVADLVDDGRLRPTTTAVLEPISAATLREAHERIETGRTLGKVVLQGWQ